MMGSGVPGEAYYDASRGTNHGHGSPAGLGRTAETERVLARTENARLVVALVLVVVLVGGFLLLTL